MDQDSMFTPGSVEKLFNVACNASAGDDIAMVTATHSEEGTGKFNYSKDEITEVKRCITSGTIIEIKNLERCGRI